MILTWFIDGFPHPDRKHFESRMWSHCKVIEYTAQKISVSFTPKNYGMTENELTHMIEKYITSRGRSILQTEKTDSF